MVVDNGIVVAVDIGIVSGSTFQNVFTVAAHQNVVACITVDDIVTVATIQIIVAVAAVEVVVATHAVNGIITASAIEAVATFVTGQDVIAVVAGSKNIGRAGQGNIFDVGSGSMGNAAEYGIFAAVSLFNHHIFYIINVVSVIAVSAFHNIGTGFAIDNIIAGCADQMVIAVAAIDGLAAFGMLSQGNIEIFGKAVYIQFLCADDELGDCRCCTVLSVLVFDG